MRRGFKTEARDTAMSVRSELGLTPFDPLDPARLAEQLDIPVEPLSSFLAAAPSIRVLLGKEAASFSAMTVLDNPARMIVVNDKHTPGRQSNSIAHEIAHALLFHPASPPFDPRGLRNHSSELEDEASFLAGCLLVTEEMCLRIVRTGIARDLAASSLGVSERLLRMRINQVGAVARVERSARYARPAASSARGRSTLSPGA